MEGPLPLHLWVKLFHLGLTDSTSYSIHQICLCRTPASHHWLNFCTTGAYSSKGFFQLVQSWRIGAYISWNHSHLFWRCCDRPHLSYSPHAISGDDCGHSTWVSDGFSIMTVTSLFCFVVRSLLCICIYVVAQLPAHYKVRWNLVSRTHAVTLILITHS